VNRIRISEIFYSVQGEGVNLGKPAVFVRLASCNLRCAWCDTKYALDNGVEISVREVIDEITKYRVRHLVVTGGEPLLQQRPLINLLEELKSLGFFVEVETNGTVEPNPKLVELVDQFNISPKLSNAELGGVVEARAVFHALARDCKSYFKFVVNSPLDLIEVDEYVVEHEIPNNKVLLMPQSTTPEEQIAKLPFIIDHAKKRGYRVTPRLQILAYGATRGV